MLLLFLASVLLLSLLMLLFVDDVCEVVLLPFARPGRICKGAIAVSLGKGEDLARARTYFSEGEDL